VGEVVEMAAGGGDLAMGGAESVARGFGQALVSRNAHAAAAFFALDAHILTADGTEMAGREQVVAVLRQITASDHRLEIRVGRTIVSGAVAIATQYWRRSNPEDGAVQHVSTSVARLVLARSQGGWEIAIASPWE
jgi:uncharacterized protein (TIGR02246 family)